jgi:hypothetical protein
VCNSLCMCAAYVLHVYDRLCMCATIYACVLHVCCMCATVYACVCCMCVLHVCAACVRQMCDSVCVARVRQSTPQMGALRLAGVQGDKNAHLPALWSEMGTIMIWRGLSQKGHLPPKCSVRMAIMRSMEPITARWMITGLALPSSVAYCKHTATRQSCAPWSPSLHGG